VVAVSVEAVVLEDGSFIGTDVSALQGVFEARYAARAVALAKMLGRLDAALHKAAPQHVAPGAATDDVRKAVADTPAVLEEAARDTRHFLQRELDLLNDNLPEALRDEVTGEVEREVAR
jgi:hypothetical protein